MADCTRCDRGRIMLLAVWRYARLDLAKPAEYLTLVVACECDAGLPYASTHGRVDAIRRRLESPGRMDERRGAIEVIEQWAPADLSRIEARPPLSPEERDRTRREMPRYADG